MKRNDFNKKNNQETKRNPKGSFVHKKIFPRRGGQQGALVQGLQTPIDDALEAKFGKEHLQKLAFLTKKRIEENLLLEKQHFESSFSPQKDQHMQSPVLAAPTRGFALAQFKKRELSVPQKETKTSLLPPVLVLDDWQTRALEALLAGKHVVIDAPTSAGKTRVIEALLAHRRQEGVRFIYTSPVKSLSNDKYMEFCEKYGREAVGINTGDFKENLGAPLILATLETYRNSLLGIEPNMERQVVVYDEYHFLQDESRGSAWEESLILTPPGTQLVLLSASVPNTEDFAQWITALTGKETVVIQVTTRPVPLVHLIFTKYGWIFAEDLKMSQQDEEYFLKISQNMRRDKRSFRGRDLYNALGAPVFAALDFKLGPIVVYAGRRGDVEGIALSFARFAKKDFEGPQAFALRERLKNLQGFEYIPSELQKLITRYGIAYHHSGLIPPGRVAIETLLKEGLLRVCCGTMGISLGVNFAVRSTFIFDESRPSEGGETLYSNTEIMQMLGRAGRRGRDQQGFSLWLHVGRYLAQRPQEREACQSSLKFDPTTVIGILGQHSSVAYLASFYQKSFFMRNQKETQVIVADHDLISGMLYQKFGVEKILCKSIVDTYAFFVKGKQKSQAPCQACPAKKICHFLMAQAQKSTLNKIVDHLRKVGALEGSVPTLMGNLARHFPQAGGLIIAHWLAEGHLNHENFFDYLPAMAAFGAAHFKEIPETYANSKFLRSLNIPSLIEKYYPNSLFPDLYDDLKGRKWENPHEEQVVFREFNYGAASVVRHWLNPRTQWSELVDVHGSKYFSEGDCMNVLFRFFTFLQSCARLEDFEPAIAAHARRLQHVLLREPLDARNRMLVDEPLPQTP